MVSNPMVIVVLNVQVEKNGSVVLDADVLLDTLIWDLNVKKLIKVVVTISQMLNGLIINVSVKKDSTKLVYNVSVMVLPLVNSVIDALRNQILFMMDTIVNVKMDTLKSKENVSQIMVEIKEETIHHLAQLVPSMIPTIVLVLHVLQDVSAVLAAIHVHNAALNSTMMPSVRLVSNIVEMASDLLMNVMMETMPMVMDVPEIATLNLDILVQEDLQKIKTTALSSNLAM